MRKKVSTSCSTYGINVKLSPKKGRDKGEVLLTKASRMHR